MSIHPREIKYVPCFIYKCSQEENNGYDTYDSFVCMARSEEEARNMNPAGDYWGSPSCRYEWVTDPSKVAVELLGNTQAPECNLPFFVLKSFNAG